MAVTHFFESSNFLRYLILNNVYIQNWWTFLHNFHKHTTHLRLLGFFLEQSVNISVQDNWIQTIQYRQHLAQNYIVFTDIIEVRTHYVLCIKHFLSLLCIVSIGLWYQIVGEYPSICNMKTFFFPLSVFKVDIEMN